MSTTDKFPKFSVSLQNAPNDKTFSATLAKSDRARAWYFESDLGDQWMAKQEDDHLAITGSDIAWEEVRLGAADVKRELRRIMEHVAKISSGQSTEQTPSQAQPGPDSPAAPVPFAVAGVILHDCEILWVASVMTAMVEGLSGSERPLN